MLNIKRFFLPKEVLRPINRTFPQAYFRDNTYNAGIITDGFVLVKNAVKPEYIEYLNNVYLQLEQHQDFAIGDEFQNSGRFQSPEIRSFVMNSINKFSANWMTELFAPQVFDPNTTGAFQIKPPSKKSTLNPHQDSPVIDETIQNALFVWIPLCDINQRNGPVYVLPKSHLWGNYQRSLNVPWVFEKHVKLAWKHMQPILMNKGDILCWDSALIHGSSPNLSDEVRIAITTTLLPKDFKMYDYFYEKNSGMIEKYEVKKSFWESGNIMDRPPVPPNTLVAIEQPVFPVPPSRSQMKGLIVG